MAKKTNSYVRKWIDNFKKSPLVDRKARKFRPTFAQQLFYGGYGDEYSEEYPRNFQQFYNVRDDREKSECIDTTLRFLNFVGIELTRESVDLHLQKMPDHDEVFNAVVGLSLRPLTPL